MEYLIFGSNYVRDFFKTIGLFDLLGRFYRFIFSSSFVSISTHGSAALDEWLKLRQNVSGNKYRLIARIRYDYRLVNIRAVLTHKAYSENKWKD